MADYSPVNPKPSPGTGIDPNEGRDDFLAKGKNIPSLENLEGMDLSTEEGKLKAAYALGAMGQGSNLGLDAFMAQADLNRDGKALWEIEKIKIGGQVYDVSVAASGSDFLMVLSV